MEQNKQSLSTIPKYKNKKNYTPQTQKSLIQSHCIQQITQFNPPPLCFSHSQQIGHMCFTCQAKCLCPKCFNQGQHKNHQVKTLQRSYLLVQANLNQYLIRIKSKADLLSLLHDNIANFQTQITQQFQVFKDHIEANFDRVLRILAEKKQMIINNLTQTHQQHLQKTKNIMTDIRHSIKDSMSVYKLIDHKIKQLPNYLLCLFYSNKKKHIQQLVSEETLHYFRQMIPSVNWNINTHVFKELQKKLQDIQFIKTFTYHPQISQKNTSNKISKKKLRKISKIPTFQKNRKPRQSHPVSPTTPKQHSQQKDKLARQLCKRVKSPGYQMLKSNRKQFGKMYSMPASPIKDRKQNSPTLIFDFQKKKSKKRL